MTANGTEAKAADATELHIATAGRAAFEIGPVTWDFSSVAGRDLVKRYGMWVARCVSLNAQAAAGVPFKLMRVERNRDVRKDLTAAGVWRQPAAKTVAYLKGRLGTQPSSTVRKAIRGNLEDMVEVDQHPLLDLLHEANDWTSGCQYRVGLYSDLQIFGKAYDLLIDEMQPSGMWSLRPQLTTPVKDRVEFVSGFKYGEDPDSVIYSADEVLWYRMYDPEDPWGGVGPLEAWLKTVDASFAIQDFQIDLMRRMGSPDWLLTKAEMSPDQKRAFWREWQKLFGTMFRRNRNIAIMGGDAELQRLNDTPRELEYNASAEAKRNEIGQAFGVPESILSTSVIRANSREAKNAHIEGTVWPYVQLVEDVWNQKLAPRWGDGLFIVHENPIPDDETIRIQERASKLASGWTPNELRIEEGAEPLPDPAADEAYLPSTLIPLRAGTLRLDSDMAAAESALADSMGSGEPAEEPALDVDVQPEQVLAGPQIAQALAIIQAVIDDQIPIAAARGLLQVGFNLEPGQVDVMLADVENFEKPEPVMPPALQPPSGDESTPSPAGDTPPPAPPEVRHILLAHERHFNAIYAKLAALGLEQKATSNGYQPTQITVHNTLPETAHVTNVEPTQVEVVMPELPAPVVNVVNEKGDPDMTVVNVTQDAQPLAIPDVYVEAPQVEAHIEPQEVKVHVDQPAPIVNVENKQDTPNVEVYVEPQIEVNVDNEIELPERKITIQRDRDTGAISGAEVTDNG